MRILIAGASGFIGSHLVPYLRDQGHDVVSLTRDSIASPGIFWNPETGQLPAENVEGFDAWINLAGENIVGRWSKWKKKRILQSRIQSTQLLVKTMRYLKHKPKIFISTSATGYYGSRSDDVLYETEPAGNNFLAEVCQEWEEEAMRASEYGIRVVLARFGMVLAKDGGALKKMLLPFSLGLGGEIGSGQQWMSWIAMDDLVSMMEFFLKHSELQGAFNVVAPVPVTNAVFTEILAKELHRPAFIPMPAWLCKLVFGQFGVEVFLASVRAMPTKILKAGFAFQYPDLHRALVHIL